MKYRIPVLLAGVLLCLTACWNDPQPDQSAAQPAPASGGTAQRSASAAATDRDCTVLDSLKRQYPEQPEPNGLLVTVADLRKHLGCLYVADVQRAQTGGAMAIIYVTASGRFTQYHNGSLNAAQAWNRLHKPLYSGAAPHSQRMELVGVRSTLCNDQSKRGCMGLLGPNQQGDPATYTEIYIYNRTRGQFVGFGADTDHPFTDRAALVALIEEVAAK